MAVLTLQGCKHPILKSWGYSDELMEGFVTCMVCYERFHATYAEMRAKDKSGLRHAAPAPMCEHRNKNVIEKDPKYKHGDYTDALCEDCGVVLRHPEGPGGWHEVIFNGYVIREEP